MRTTMNFITNAVKAALVFMVVFCLPAIMIALIWLKLDLYLACVHSPTYCAVMFVMAGLVTYVYIGSRLEKSRPRLKDDDLFG